MENIYIHMILDAVKWSLSSTFLLENTSSISY